MDRGVSAEESLTALTKKESGLEIYNLRMIGMGRTFFYTSPFDHGRGTDTDNRVYFARGQGEIKLDALHSAPTLLTPDSYQAMRNGLEDYVTTYIDFILEKGLI